MLFVAFVASLFPCRGPRPSPRPEPARGSPRGNYPPDAIDATLQEGDRHGYGILDYTRGVYALRAVVERLDDDVEASRNDVDSGHGGEDAVSPLDGSSPVEAEVVRSAEAPF